jgi:WD40 repeat protein
MSAADRRGIASLPRRACELALVAALLTPASLIVVAQSATSGTSGTGLNPVPESLPRAELVLQTGHTGSVNALALSPDGRFLVSGSEDVTLKIWDTATGNVLRTLSGHDQAVLAAAISPDGRLIASGSADQTVRVWNVVTGQSTRVATHTSPVKNVVFSDDGRRLTSLGNDEVKVSDVASGKELTSVRSGPDSDSKGMAAAGAMDQVATALSPNGKLAALGGGFTYRNGVMGFGGGLRTRPLRVIDVATGREVESFKLAGNLSSPTDLSFSPDSRVLVAKFVEQGARDISKAQSWLGVFEVASGRELKKLSSTDAMGMGGIAFSPDGKLLASRMTTLTGSVDLNGSVSLLDTGTWREVRTLAKTGFDMNLSTLGATPLTFSLDGRWIATSLGDGVALFDTTTGERIQNLRTRHRVSAVTASGNDQATANEAMTQAGVDPDMMSQIRETMSDLTGSLIGQMSGLASSALTFSPDGRHLTAARPRVVWDLVAGAPQPPNQRVAATPTVTDILGVGATPAAYSADGRLSASVSGDETGGFAIVVKDAKTDDVVRRIAVGTADTGGRTQKVKGPFGQQMDIPGAMMRQLQISGLAFSARGLVVHYCETDFGKGGGMFGGGGGREACHAVTTDPASGKQLRDLKLDGPKNSLGSMMSASVMSPDGRFLVTVAMSGFSGGGNRFGLSLPGLGGGGGSARPSYTVTTTDLETGKRAWETKIESENQLRPPSVVFSPNGAQLAVVTQEKDQTAIKVLDAATRREVSSFGAAGPNIHSMVFSRDGKRIALTYGSAAAFGAFGSNRAIQKADRGEPVVTIHDLAAGRRAATLVDDAPIVGVAFDTTGRLVATVGEDGNQDLWDAQTGERVATLITLVGLGSFGATEWLVVTPDGLFDGSPGAWQQIMWRFSENTFDVGPVEIFFNELYYPSLLSDIMAGKRPRAPRSLPQLDRRQPDLRLTLESPVAGDVASRTVAVSIEVAELPADAQHAQGSGARDVRLFRNGTMVKVWRGDVLKGQPRARLQATLPIVAGPNRITAYAFNHDNVKSADAFIAVNGSAQLARKGVSYVLAFGVNEYANPQFNLKYARPDANAFAEEARVQGAKLEAFERVEVVSLVDGHATKAHFLSALNRLATGADVPAGAPPELSRLQRAQPEDAVTIYFAGHGTAKGPRFYLVPHDLGYAGPRASVGAESVAAILSHSVSDLEIEAAVEGLDSSQVLLVIDACNSGQALEAEERRRGPMNSKGLAQLAYEKGMFILTAAQSYQAALETAQLGHGYLTYALVEEGLRKSLADRRAKDGEITVREWFDYATDRVPEMQGEADGARLLLLQDDKVQDPNVVRSLQRPRAFYRREVELRPVVVARP